MRVLLAGLLCGIAVVARPETAAQPEEASPGEINAGSGVEHDFNLSNDGQWLVFSSFKGAGLLDFGKSKLANLPAEWGAIGAGVSPQDSTFAMYLQREGRTVLALWRPGSQQTRELLTVPRDLYVRPLQWSVDGKKVYVLINQHLPWPRSDARDDHPPNVSNNVALDGAGRYGIERRRQQVEQEYPGAHAESTRSLILEVDVASGRTGLLALGNDVDRLYPSPDGRYLAAVQLKQRAGADVRPGSAITAGDVYLIEIPAATLPAIDLESFENRRAGWSDHARRRLRPVLENVQTLPSFQGFPAGLGRNPMLAWAPGGAAFAYATIGRTASGDVFVYDLKARRTRNLTQQVQPGADKRFDFARHVVRSHESPRFGSVFNPLWMADASALVVTARGNVWRIPLSPVEAPANLTQNLSPEVLRIVSAPGNEVAGRDAQGRLILIARDQVKRTDSVWKLDPVSGAATLMADTGVWTNFTVRTDAHQQRLLYTGQTPESAINLYRLELNAAGVPENLTRASPALAQRRYPQNQVLNWRTPAGYAGHGLLYLPAGASAQHRAPLIVKGFPGYPESQVDVRASLGAIFFQDELNDLLRMGIAVLYADVPMSDQGVYEQPMRQMAEGIDAATDAALATGLIDEQRLGLVGAGHAANLVNAVLTQTRRFKAAATVGGVYNVYADYLARGISGASYYETGEGRLARTLWDDPQRYVDNSPLTHWNRVETPLLIVHGAYSNVPYSLAVEGARGLRYLNKDHVLASYTRMGDMPNPEAELRIRGWFREHLLDGKAVSLIADQGSFFFGGAEN